MLGLLQVTFSNFVGDKLNEKQRHRAPKYDWERNSTRRKKVTEKDKLAIAETYERRLEEGKPRKSILEDLAKQYDRDSRTIERHISEGRVIRVKKLKNLLDLPWFANKLLESITMPEPLSVSRLKDLEMGELWVEKQPGFHTFKKYFIHKVFWDSFKSWKNERELYCQKCLEFLKTVSCEAERESQMKITEEYDEEGIYDTFPARVYQHILLKTKPQLDSLSTGYLSNLEEMHCDINGDELIVREQSSVLAKGEAYKLRRLIELYPKLTSSPSLLETGKEIWDFYHELRKTTSYLEEELSSFCSCITPNWVRFSSGLEI